MTRHKVQFCFIAMSIALVTACTSAPGSQAADESQYFDYSNAESGYVDSDHKCDSLGLGKYIFEMLGVTTPRFSEGESVSRCLYFAAPGEEAQLHGYVVLDVKPWKAENYDDHVSDMLAVGAAVTSNPAVGDQSSLMTMNVESLRLTTLIATSGQDGYDIAVTAPTSFDISDDTIVSMMETLLRQ